MGSHEGTSHSKRIPIVSDTDKTKAKNPEPGPMVWYDSRYGW